jgi:hypothetical protein
VVALRETLARGLRALGGAARGNPVFTLDHLQELAGLVLPLLASPLVGEGAAFDAVRALAASLPDPLDRQSLAVACALRVVEEGSPGRPSCLLLLIGAQSSVRTGSSICCPMWTEKGKGEMGRERQTETYITRLTHPVCCICILSEKRVLILQLCQQA